MKLWCALIIFPILAAGCEKSVNVGGGYRIAAPASPDGAHHGNTLYFNNTKVFRNVGMQQYHDHVLIFAGYMGSGDNQLFAIRDEGPAVMLSERVISKVVKVAGIFPGEKPSRVDYLDEITPIADGVRVKMFVGDDAAGNEKYESTDLSWKKISDLIAEAEAKEPVQEGEGGKFRKLKHPLPATIEAPY